MKIQWIKDVSVFDNLVYPARYMKVKARQYYNKRCAPRYAAPSLKNKKDIISAEGVSFHCRDRYEKANVLSLVDEIFLKNEYGLLNVKNAYVIDIGANIGDTALYFAGRGAKQVLALEPDPKTYAMAVRNLSLNPDLSKQISLKNVGCAERDGYIKLPAYKSTGMAPCGAFNSGDGMLMVSLKTLIKKYKIRDAVMKMDCEGCEYLTIQKTNPSLLYSSFNEIILEYHWGYRNLKKHLDLAGFKTRVVNKHPGWNPHTDTISYSGLLFATK